MKVVSFQEFVEMMNKDEELKAKFDNAMKGEGDVTSNLSKVFDEAGIQINGELPDDEENMSDEELDAVVGGKKDITWKDIVALCKKSAFIFKYDPKICDATAIRISIDPVYDEKYKNGNP